MRSLYPRTVAAVPDLLQFLQVLFTGPFLLFQALLFPTIALHILPKCYSPLAGIEKKLLRSKVNGL